MSEHIFWSPRFKSSSPPFVGSVQNFFHTGNFPTNFQYLETLCCRSSLTIKHLLLFNVNLFSFSVFAAHETGKKNWFKN